MTLQWYLNRLRTMSAGELTYRFTQIIKTRYYRNFRKGKTARNIHYRGVNTILPMGQIDFGNINFNFNPDFKIFKQHLNLFEAIDWHLDLSSGEHFPMAYSRSINTRTHEKRSAKYVWEVNRLQFLPLISLEYKKTKENKYLDLFIKIIDSWIDHNPYLIGVNWYSNIELNIRLIVWFVCWEILNLDDISKRDSKINNFIRHKWIPVIYMHCKHTFNNISRYSSANNHLISELAGLFVASSFWNFKESGKWKRFAKKGMETEIINQHTNNGINKEQTSEYMQFITDFFLVAHLVAEYTNNSFSEQYTNQLKSIFRYINTFLDIRGNIPKYGDEDDGRVFFSAPANDFNYFKSLLTSASIIFPEDDFKKKSNGFELKNLILFGEEGKTSYNKSLAVDKTETSTLYPDDGHFFLKHQKNSLEEVFIHFNAAPLGYLAIAAHGHADALSISLHINGQPVLIDPGTYTYHTEKKWRDYFRGTIAHNTIRINRMNQATIGGPTMWRDHYETKIIKAGSSNEFDNIQAEHDGYFKVFGIIHQRELHFDKKQLIIEITDQIILQQNDTREHFMEMPFHLHPDIKIDSVDERNYILKPNTNKDFNVELQIDEILQSGKIVKGREDDKEPLGWYSPRFHEKVPTSVIYNSLRFNQSVILKTRLKIIM